MSPAAKERPSSRYTAIPGAPRNHTPGEYFAALRASWRESAGRVLCARVLLVATYQTGRIRTSLPGGAVSLPEVNGGLLLLGREPAIRFARFVRFGNRDMRDQIAANADGHVIAECDAMHAMRGGKFGCLTRSRRDISRCCQRARPAIWRGRLWRKRAGALLQQRQTCEDRGLLLLKLQDPVFQIDYPPALLVALRQALDQALDILLIDGEPVAGAGARCELTRADPSAYRALITIEAARGLSCGQ